VPDNPFGFSLPSGEPPDPSDPQQMQQMQQLLAQLQQLLASPAGGGPVNWDLARQVAANHLAGAGDPAVTTAERDAVAESLRLADLWLEPTSAFPTGVQAVAAWNRNEWIYHTLEVWKKLCDPVASRMVGAKNDLVPEGAQGQLGPMQTMVKALGGALFGGQLGHALGSLAAEVLSAGDIGLPLGPAGTAALVPANITDYGEGLSIDPDQVRLYVALREAAHQRLFGHVHWLRGHVLSAVQTYADGIRVDREAVEEAMNRFDPADPESMRQLQVDGIFAPDSTPAQAAALTRLETILAMVEYIVKRHGWS
jgi:putative hydrolase